jgi:hypothetical protein
MHGLLFLLMIFTVPLYPGTTLANVVYEWLASGAPGVTTSSGVTQPDTNFAVFRIDSVPPTNAEEMIVWDSTDLTNWNVAGYRAGLSALAGAQQILLTAPYAPTTAPSTIVPGNPPQLSICRCHGTWNDISALSVDGVPMIFTLVAVDNTDPTIIYDLSATPLKNTETSLIFAQRVVNAMLVAGALQNVNEDNFVDLNRTDYISGYPDGTTLNYLLTCDAIGAPASLALMDSTSPLVFQPVLFQLNSATIGLTSSGTFDVSKKAVT